MSNQTNAKEKAAAKAPARMSKKDPLTKSQLELINGGGHPTIWPPASSTCWTTPCCGSP